MHIFLLVFLSLLLWLYRLLDEFTLVVLLSNPIRDMSRYGAHLLGSLNVEHLVIKEDMWFDFLQQRSFRCPSEEQSLVNLQAPAAKGLQDTSP